LDRRYGQELELVYDVATRWLYLDADSIQVEERSWDNTGKLVSILDLLDAQMIVRMGHTFGIRVDQDNIILQSMLKRVKISQIDLEIGKGRTFSFSEDDFQRYTDSAGYPFYVRRKMGRE
jgi:hypothetical protein